MRLKLRRSLLAVITLVAASTLLPAGAALASNGDGNCELNEACVYKDTYATGYSSDFQYYYEDMDGGVVFHSYNYPKKCNDLNSGYYELNECRLNDSISSAEDYSDHRSIRYFTNAHYDGNYQTEKIGGRLYTMKYNDQTSSECWNDGGVKKSTDADCTFSN